MTFKKHRRPRLLSSTRPRNSKPAPTLPSSATRSLVRSHHTLRKQLSAALSNGDIRDAQSIQAKIDADGGLPRYQEASIQGQSAQRGGDTSKILVEWLDEEEAQERSPTKARRHLRMLEVGALSPDNACARSGLFEIERIDLHSRHHTIKEQDFMERPTSAAETLDQKGFDIVSLSLVVNFVVDAGDRGEMLRRASSFLRPYSGYKEGFFPSLFLVLPAPCVTNSRYLDEEKLDAIMESLSYRRVKRKMSSKLVYYLWKYEARKRGKSQTFNKREVKSGKSRNNFAIMLH